VTTTSLSSSSIDLQQRNQNQYQHQYPMESLLGPLDSGSASEAEEILRMNGDGDDKYNEGDGNKNNNNNNGNDNDNDDDEQNGKERKQMKDERDNKNNGGDNNVPYSPTTKEGIDTPSRKNYYISPRPVPMYVEDYKTNDKEVDTLNSNNEGRHDLATIIAEQQQHRKQQQRHPKPPLSDDLSETDSASHEQDILESILSSPVSSLIEQQKSVLSEERGGNVNVVKQKPSNDDYDDDGISYDTASSQGKLEGCSSVEPDKINSPPHVDHQVDVLADILGSPEQEQIKENMVSIEDENDSVTPKRKTIRIGGGGQNIATEANDERKKNGGEDESIKPRAQRKRIYSDGKRAPKHRRKKSGDDVAATLLTGSADWIGMELDKLPLPSQNEEDEDDEEDIEKGTKGEEISLEESANFGNMRSEERANRRSRRKSSESPLRQLKEKGGDAWMTLRGNMPVAEFSKYAQSTEENETGMNLSSRFVPRVPKEEYIPKETSIPNSLARHESMGNASVSSTGSQGTSTSAFSWISNRISLLSVKDETERSDEIFSALDNSTHNREPIHYTPIPEEFTNNTVGQTIDIQEQQRKNAAVYDAHMMTLNDPVDMQPYPLQPTLETDDGKRSFICPRCNTRQREFFTVATVPKTFENPISFMVVYFVVYVILALFIFGVEEGWPTLDCVYFSIMTLTTIGLGDYVPTSNSAKIVCSIFMYFGIACFGLILGLLHANSLDHASRKAAEENMVSSCPICCEQEEQTIPKADKKSNRVHGYPSPRRRRNLSDANNGMAEDSPFIPKRSLSPISSRRSTLHTIDERPGQTGWYETENNTRERDDHSEGSSQMSTISLDDRFRPVSQIKAAKYIFLTLKQAFANTLFIIGIGSIGCMYFEKMTTVNAFYFTTSLLTTVGYGDIVPKTPGGKVFASGYAVIAWIFLLYNISMISMIPLELRKRRIEHAVLIQFGEELDDATLHELISGPLVRRITGMTDNYNYPMDHCTREMFALTMLVRLGRITEQDIRSTFAAFQKLDKNNDGILTSKHQAMRGMRTSLPQDNVASFPRQRISNSSLSETSALLHPLSTNIKASDEGVNYMSTSMVSDPTAMSTAMSSIKEVETAESRRLMRTRGMSLESLWSNFTDENWDDNP